MNDIEADMADLYDRECRVLPDWALSDVDLAHRATLNARLTLGPQASTNPLSERVHDPQPESEATL